MYGKSAYPPLMLLKAIFRQKWFGIKSNPELETQINDRISFRTFIGLTLADPSPDHSIICRFREHVGKEVLEDIHHELLDQVDSQEFSIESGMAVDARIVKSASRPVFGMKGHAAIDVKSGLVLSTTVSRASEHDTNHFQYKDIVAEPTESF